MNIVEYNSPVGTLLVGGRNGRLCMCDWKYRPNRQAISNRLSQWCGAQVQLHGSSVVEAAFAQLDEYFSGERRHFDLPLLTCGTEFQRRVWDELLTVDYGQVITYGQLAQRIGRPTAVRAVAAAVGANALSIFIPCHRVIGVDGNLTGYAGGMMAKQYLLELEAAVPRLTQQGLTDSVTTGI